MAENDAKNETEVEAAKTGEDKQELDTAGSEATDGGSSITHATLRQKITLSALLVVSTILMVAWGHVTLRDLESLTRAEVYVEWEFPEGLTLKPGPPSFRYDKKNNKLIHRGPISNEIKEELIKLARVGPLGQVDDAMDKTPAQTNLEQRATKPEGTNSASRTDGEGEPPTPKHQDALGAYHDAIDELAFASAIMERGNLMLILLLGGIGGVIGVQLRSITNFIGVTCFKQSLDVNRFWPWYAMRPFAGFLLGVLIVVLIKADLIGFENRGSDGSLWWLGMAILVGYGASDFTERLRLLTKTLFGKNE